MFPILIGHLDPIDTVSGQKARVNNLGYFAGPLDQVNEALLRPTVEEFQCEHLGKTYLDGISASLLELKPLPVFVGPSVGDEFNTVRSFLLPSPCFRWEDNSFDFESSSAFDFDAGPPKELMALHPGSKLSIFGLLTRDVAVWEDLYRNHDTKGRDKWGVKTGPPSPTNDRNTHGLIVENAFPLAEVGLPPAFNVPEEGTFAEYDLDNRRRFDQGFRPDETLWLDNAMGFRASAGFVPPFVRSVAPADLKTKSWADLFFYREDDADLSLGSRLVRSDAAFAPDP